MSKRKKTKPQYLPLSKKEKSIYITVIVFIVVLSATVIMWGLINSLRFDAKSPNVIASYANALTLRFLI